MLKKSLRFTIFCIVFTMVFSARAEATDYRLFGEYENVPLDKVWTIEFNKPINKDSSNNTTIFIKDDFGRNIESTIEFETDKTVVVRPNAKYDSASIYYLYVTNGVKGLQGDLLKEQIYIKFLTSKSEGVNSEKFVSSHFSKEFVKAEVLPDNKLKVEGSTLGQYRYASVQIKDGNTGEIVIDRFININNKMYNNVFSVPLKDGNYTFNVYYGLEKYGRYNGVYRDIPLITKNTIVFFPKSAIYEDNLIMVSKNNEVVNSDIEIYGLGEKDRSKLKNLAEDITKGITDEYEKIFEISKWISTNIYYDWDAYYANKYVPTDAISTLLNKKSVCQGYAELTRELVKSIGLPARLVSGHALGASANGKSWDGVDHTSSNHAWNEVFVDGHWIIIDNTWNSNNQYIDGKFNQNDAFYRYFDANIEAFSHTHKILNR